MTTATFPRLTWTSALVLVAGFVIALTVWGATSRLAEAASDSEMEDSPAFESFGPEDYGPPPPPRGSQTRSSHDARDCTCGAQEGPPRGGRDSGDFRGGPPHDRQGPPPSFGGQERGPRGGRDSGDFRGGPPHDRQGPPPSFGGQERGPRGGRHGSDNWSSQGGEGFGGPGRRGHGPPDPEALFSDIDANEDGMLSKEEFMQFHEQRRPPSHPEHRGGGGPRSQGGPERGFPGPGGPRSQGGPERGFQGPGGR